MGGDRLDRNDILGDSGRFGNAGTFVDVDGRLLGSSNIRRHS
jgi:hypothetical protein